MDKYRAMLVFVREVSSCCFDSVGLYVVYSVLVKERLVELLSRLRTPR